MPVNAWVLVSPEVRRIAAKYDIPAEVLAAARGIEVERLARAYKVGVDEEYKSLVEAADSEFEVFGQPLAFKAEPVVRSGERYVRLTIRLPALSFSYLMEPGEFKKHTPDEWREMLSDWVFAKVKRREIVDSKRNRRIVLYTAEKLTPVRVNVDTETALELVKAYRGLGKPVLAAGAALLGYNPVRVLKDPALTVLVTAYLLPLVKPSVRLHEKDRHLHGVILTLPGMGKSTVALKYRFYMRWKYFSEPPSKATLVGDARVGKPALSGSNGVFFDETDKWFDKKSSSKEIAEAMSVLLTGMEQGYWSRGKGGVHSIEYHRFIPVVFGGNVKHRVEPRAKFVQLLSKASADGAAALEQRLAYAVTVATDISDAVMKAVMGGGRAVVSRPSVLRGFKRLLEEWYMEAPGPGDTAGLRGRYAESYRNVYRALMVLFAADPVERRWADADAVAELARKLVEGVVL